MKICSSVSHFLYLAFICFLIRVRDIKNRALTTLQHLCMADAFPFYTTKKAEAASELHCGLANRYKNSKDVPDFLQCRKSDQIIFIIIWSLKSVHLQSNQGRLGTVLNCALHIQLSPFLMTCEHQWREHWLKRAKYQNVGFSEHWKMSVLSAPHLAAGTGERCALKCIWRHFRWGRGKCISLCRCGWGKNSV